MEGGAYKDNSLIKVVIDEFTADEFDRCHRIISKAFHHLLLMSERQLL